MKKHTNLRVYERAGVYPQSIAYYFDMFYLPVRKYPYLAKFWEVVASIRGYFYWARDTNHLEKSMRKWVERWLVDLKERNRIYDFFRRDKLDLQRIIQPLIKKDLTRLNNRDLYKIYRTTLNFALKHLHYAEYTVDLFDDYFAKFFLEYLQKNNITLVSGDLSYFIQPATTSASAEYKQAILKLSFLKKVADKEVNKLIKKYSWIRMSWDGDNELGKSDVIKDIDELKKINKKARFLELKNIQTLSSRVIKIRSSLVKKYGLGKKQTGHFFDLLDHFNIFHDYRKETQMRCNQVIYRILREIPKRFNLLFENLMWYFNDEVRELLLNNKLVPAKVIEKRKNGLVFHINNDKIKKYYGQRAVKKLEELVLSVMKAQKANEIVGIPAGAGKATGVAFVCKDGSIANRDMSKGAILVTSMTTIDFLPAIRRAGAVVTDDGGATCHAAIVSRELGVPCVVGTKVATQLLKTGDVVEVDGGAGVVKVVQK